MVWLLLLVSTVAAALAFLTIYSVYMHLNDSKIVNKATSYVDFIILLIGNVAESTPIPWFQSSWSGGRLLTGFWMVFGTFIVFAFSSNLRANLVAREYEKPLRTEEDIVKRGKAVYIPDNIVTIK